MAQSSGTGRRWLKYGCLGCVGVVGLVVLIVAVVVGVALTKARSQQIEDQVVSQEVPSPALPPPPGVETGGAESIGAGPVEAAGHVILRLQHADFEIRPGPPGGPVRVEATYDKKSYTLEQRFEAPEGAPWTYEVGFRGSGASLITTLMEMLGGTSPRVRVLLPVDVPLSLDFELREGGAEVELGKLWLTSADIEFNRSGFQLGVDRPLRAPMERLSIVGSMGGFEASSLGNASPRELEVDFSMGGMDLDLRGRWAGDSDISLRSSMGGGVLRLPRDVRIEGLATSRIGDPTETEVEPPTLRFSVSSDMGNLEILD